MVVKRLCLQVAGRLMMPRPFNSFLLVGMMFLAVAAKADVIHVYQCQNCDGVVEQLSDVTQNTGTDFASMSAPAVTGYLFTHWSINRQQEFVNRDAWGRALDAVSCRLYEATTLTANYLPVSRDADNDGVADGYEIYWYGDLSKNAASDTDGDGRTFAQEMADSTNPLFPDEDMIGEVLNFDSGTTLYNPNGYAPYVIRSEPEGALFATVTEYVRPGTVITTASYSPTDGNFAYWTVNGVRMKDEWGVASNGVSFAAADGIVTECVAHSIADRMERMSYYWYGDRAHGESSDTDGDGFTFAQEIANGTNPLFPDESNVGEVLNFDSGVVQYNPRGYVAYVIRSEPEGALFETQSDYKMPGTSVTTPSLAPDTSSFAYWTLNGARQQDEWGIASNSVSFLAQEEDITLIAYSAADEAKRHSLYWYGDESHALDSDTDGDGFTFAQEIANGTNPLFPDENMVGEVLNFDSGVTEVNLQVYEQVQGAVVGGAYSQVFTSPIAGNAATSATFGNGGAVWPVVADVNGDGLWDLVVCWEGGVKVFVNVGSKGNPEFEEGGSQLAATANIDFAMNSPEKLAGLTLDVPPPSDALSATTNGTALLVSDSEGRIWYYQAVAQERDPPAFALQHKVWGGSHAGFAQGLRLAAVDWEDDGDLDCLAGTADGKLMLLRDPKVGRPTNLKALAGVDNVLLTWDPNAQSRIRGYRVYRGNGEFARIAQTPLPTYRDFPAVAGNGDSPEFAYKVSSVSRFYTAGNSTPTETESTPTEAVTAQLGGVKFFWNDVAVKLGEKAEVMLSIENSMNYNVAGKTQMVAFDPSYLSFVKVVKTGLTEDVALSASCVGGLLTISMTGGTLAAGGGKFLVLVFDTIREGTTTVGEATVSIVAVPGGGQTDVPPYSLGDVNGDGKLDERDVREFVKVNKDISPAGRKPTANQIKAGDFTGDGKIGAADVQPFIAFMAAKGITVKLSNALK